MSIHRNIKLNKKNKEVDDFFILVYSLILQNQVFAVASKLANKLEQTLHCDGINILSNVHEAAGQSVNHFHVHLIPRYKDNDRVYSSKYQIEQKK